MKEDTQYAISLLERLNNIKVGHRSIYEMFMTKEGLSSWSFQQFSLREEIKRFSRNKNFADFIKGEKSASLWQNTKTFLLQILALIISLYFIVKILILRTKILTYSPDVLKGGTRLEARMIGVYKELKQMGASYGEVAHTLLDKTFLKNIITRRRAVFYLESLNFLPLPFRRCDKTLVEETILSNISLEAFSEEEKKLAFYLINKYSLRSRESLRITSMLRTLFSLTAISLLITIDDVRYYNELLTACKKLGIKTVAFQHSNFDYFSGLDKLPASTYIFPDIFYVWNGYWHKRILELSPLFRHFESRLRIGGRTNDFVLKEVLPKTASIDGKISVLIPYEVNVDKGEFNLLIQKLTEDNRLRVVFKGRRDIEEYKQIEAYGLKDMIKNGKVIFKSDMTDVELSEIDVVIGVYTTLIDEMIEREKPVIMIKTDYLVFNDLASAGLAVSVPIRSSEIFQAIEQAANMPIEELARRRKVFTENTGDMNEVLKSLLEEVGVL